MNPKMLLLLFGSLMLIGAAWGQSSTETSSPLSIADKRRIIRDMLEAQKDIKKALIKIRHQIEGDLNSTGHNGATDDDSDEDDDIDDEYGGMSGEEEEEFYKERQRQIREAREHLESRVRQIISSFTAMTEYIHRIDLKIDEAIRASHYNSNQAQAQGGAVDAALLALPFGYGGFGGYGAYGAYGKGTGQSQPEAPTPVEDEPFRPIVGPGSGKRNKKPISNYRTSRSLDKTIPTVDTEKLSSPDIPSIVGYEGPVQKTVEFQLNQQQVEQ